MLSTKALELARFLAEDSIDQTEHVLDTLENDPDLYRELEPLLVLYSHPVNSLERLDRSTISQYLEIFMDPDAYLERFRFMDVFDLIDDAGSDPDPYQYGDLDPEAFEFLAHRYDYFKDVIGLHGYFGERCGTFFENGKPFSGKRIPLAQFGMMAFPKQTASAVELQKVIQELIRIADQEKDLGSYGSTERDLAALLSAHPELK